LIRAGGVPGNTKEGSMPDETEILDDFEADEEESELGLAAAEAMRPEGLSDREWALVRRDRAELAEEERRNAVWAPVIEELNKAISFSLPLTRRCGGKGINSHGGLRATAKTIRRHGTEPSHSSSKRAGAYGWNRDQEIESFAAALMRSEGYDQVDIRNHGLVWEYVGKDE
jgi:hypothetical protein